MNTQLQDAFHRQEPELVLAEYNSNDATFNLLDCDGYLVGLMRCLGVRALCVTTGSESYGWIDCYARANLPDDLAWLAEGIPEGFSVLLLGLADEDSSSESVLPVIGGRRLAYIVCQSVEYQALSGGR